MNKRNDYTEIWKLANADLEKYGMQIELQKDDCDAYSVIVKSKNGQSECFAEGYYEDELDEVINEAYAHALAKAKSKQKRKGVKVTKRATNDGPRYAISGLTFDQIFRVKQAMADCERKMKGIAANECADCPPMQKDFEGFARDAHEVFMAIVDVI